MARKRASRRKLMIAGGVSAFGFALLVSAQKLGFLDGLRGRIVQHITERVVVADTLAPADAIFIFNGKVDVRATHAATVYRLGFAPRILLVTTEDSSRVRGGLVLSTSDRITRELQRRGVPASAIEVIYAQDIRTTRDEARALRNFLSDTSVSRLIAVTTDYHTGRAKHILRQELGGLPITISMAAAPNNNIIDPYTWWRNRVGRNIYTSEYMKLLYTRLHGSLRRLGRLR